MFLGWTHVIRGALIRLKLKVIGFAMEKKLKMYFINAFSAKQTHNTSIEKKE